VTQNTFALKIQRELCHPKSFGTLEKQALGRDSNSGLCDFGAALVIIAGLEHGIARLKSASVTKIPIIHVFVIVFVSLHVDI